MAADPTMSLSGDERFATWRDRLEPIVSVAALLVIPVLALEQVPEELTAQIVGLGLNWLVWMAFCAEFAILLVLAPNRVRYAVSAGLNVLLIVVSAPFWSSVAMQGSRALRVVRVLRLLRVFSFSALALRRLRGAFARRHLHHVSVIAVLVILAGAVSVYVLERGQNPSIKSPGDALWWSIVTATTVGGLRRCVANHP